MPSKTRLYTQLGVLDYDQFSGGLAQACTYGRAFSTVLFAEISSTRAELCRRTDCPSISKSSRVPSRDPSSTMASSFSDGMHLRSRRPWRARL